MASAWIDRRAAPSGEARYRVRYRLGGRATALLSGGTFRALKEARMRRDWIAGELAAMRVPDLDLALAPAVGVTLAAVAEAWRKSRVDVSEGTADTHRVNLGRIPARLKARPVDRIAPLDVAELVGELIEAGLARESIRKTVGTLAMVFDFAGVVPNPARDRLTVKMPRDDRVEVEPPVAEHVLAVLRILPRRYRLPLLVLDATGMRIGELERLAWRDVDEPGSRWRVRREVAKTRRSRWVPVPPGLLMEVADLVPREDRVLAGQVFAGFGADAFRTTLGRACKAAAVPEFSPHDLRHRRATLWHLSGVPVVEAASWLGHSPQEHLRTYAHVSLSDRSELEHAHLARAVAGRDPSVIPDG